MKNRNFIFTGLQSWDIPIGSNAIDIAREMAKDNRVLYINSPLDMMTVYRNKSAAKADRRMDVMKKKQAALRRINENIWVLDCTFVTWSVNQLPDGWLFDAFNKRNNQLVFKYVRQVANDLKFENPIHFIDNDIYRSFYSKEILDPALSVYYRRDNLHPFPYWKKHVPRLEPKLIGKSDIVLCNSPQLAGFAKQFNRKTFDVGQGVDLSAYNPEHQGAIPADLDAIPGPRIGYIGDINSMRLDATLLYELAESRPQYSFVMIGNEDQCFQLHELHSLKNMYFTGSVAKSKVPDCMACMDVCINPQLVNDITMGNYPRKIDEYLAMGKPVVATRTGTMELFENHTYLCSSLSEYQQAIDRALEENSAEKQAKRIQFARSHSWQNNVQTIYNHIQQNLK